MFRERKIDSILPCNFHRSGVPTYAMGKDWYSPGCPECEAKKAKGLVSETDPTAHELWRKYGEQAFKGPGRARHNREHRLNILIARHRLMLEAEAE